ncbi:MAG: LacI family transcriptional regulator [Microbacteriaceae bacterium]|nr:LacI family transcriptional regulator [Microbacteriaceae bacterium]MCL2796191.1 LacI family transcriptional regulator [Microbacteriaceae bacterium]
MSDVAEAAGVSLSTVSYVLSGKRTISAPTRDRVERAIRKLGFSPNAGARALASRRAQTLGLMVPFSPDTDFGVVMQFVGAAVTAARAYDYNVLLLTHEDGSGMQREAASGSIDGILMMDVENDDPRIPILAGLSVPGVLIGLPNDSQGLSCVDFDFMQATRTAVNHLMSLGRRQIAFIGSPEQALTRRVNYAERARRGFTDGAIDAGVRHVEVACDPELDAAEAALADIRHALPHLDGLVVHNEAALPFLHAACVRAGISIPKQLSIVAVCPENIAQAAAQPWTSVSIPADQIGRIAVDMLMARIEGAPLPEQRLIGSPLVQRATTAPVES